MSTDIWLCACMWPQKKVFVKLWTNVSFHWHWQTNTYIYFSNICSLSLNQWIKINYFFITWKCLIWFEIKHDQYSLFLTILTIGHWLAWTFNNAPLSFNKERSTFNLPEKSVQLSFSIFRSNYMTLFCGRLARIRHPTKYLILFDAKLSIRD